MRLGIRYQLVLPLGLLLVGIVAASLWIARAAAARAHARVAQQIANTSQTLATANYPVTGFVLDQVKSFSGAEFIVVRPDRSRLSTFADPAVELPSDADFQTSEVDPLGPPVRVRGETYRSRQFSLKDPHPSAGAVVYLFYPDALLAEAVADAQRPSFVALALGILAVAVTFGVAQRLVGRIRDLEKRTRIIAAGDFSPMPAAGADDEVRDLTRSVNDMAERLARLQLAVQATERVRLTGQLAAGLAHQLRNSATGAKLAVEVYLAEHPEADGEALGVTLRQLAVMEANLRRFIDLGNVEVAAATLVDLGEMVDETIDLLRPRLKHADTEIHWERPPTPMALRGAAGPLADLVSNLVTNAADAAGPGGTIRVTLSHELNRMVLEIGDTGPGPSPEIAARLFEPFVTGKPEGIGLGLAVARRAAEAHGGAITWRREDGRTVFRVELATETGPQ